MCFYEFIVSSRNNKEQVSGSDTRQSRSRALLYLGLTIPESESGLESRLERVRQAGCVQG